MHNSTKIWNLDMLYSCFWLFCFILRYVINFSLQYFVSPTSGSKFRMKAEVLNYLFAEMDEHWIQSKEKAACSSMLPVCFPYYGVKSLLILVLRISMIVEWIALL
jgi:hypothetical protein